MAKPYVIGIAGASCTGKTGLAKELKLRLPAEAVVVEMDSYYRDLSGLDVGERKKQNFDSPEALDWELFAAHLRELAMGREIERPVYDFSAHTRAALTERLTPADYVIVEGLFALYRKEVREFFDTSVFIEVSDKVSFSRRVERDTRERGRTRESVRAQFELTVRPMYERHVKSALYHADVVVNGENSLASSAEAALAHVESAAR
jgi:uridine kinase